MKNLKSFTLVLISSFVLNAFGQLDADGTHFYWLEDWSKNQAYLEKFDEKNWDTWGHSASRIDAYVFRRNSIQGITSARDADGPIWQGFKKMVKKHGWVAGMNSGLMNRSWEYADRSNWSQRFKNDLSIIEISRDAGFTKIVMFMQSPLSKGRGKVYDPNIVDKTQPNGGASLDMRVQDCIEYADYIVANKVSGIEVSFALIDAFPQKMNVPKEAWRKAYKDLVVGIRAKGYKFDGFIFDMKSSFIKNNVDALSDECKYIRQLSRELGGDNIISGWYTWSLAKMTVEDKNRDVREAMEAIAAHPNRNYINHIWVAENGEKDYVPDYVVEEPLTRQARMNQVFCILEGLPMNPTKKGEELLNPNDISK
ncbi:MAG: hypothetical protein MI922_10990 [Bacteroidales bacterium]|nr:hypothetical protein [Bacteroidales bacterium]